MKIKVFLQFFFCVTASPQPCAHFDFPTVNESLVMAEENSTIILPFELKKENTCRMQDEYILKVSRIANLTHVQCTILQQNTTCLYPGRAAKCMCTDKRGMYRLSHKADRLDNAVWEWSSSNEKIKPRSLRFNVSYPPLVKELSLRHPQGSEVQAPVDEKSTIHAVCTWKDGNPPTSVRLYNRLGVEIAAGRYTSEKFRHVIPKVYCIDAGTIRCEAPGSTINKTTTLLVRCAPDIGPPSLNALPVISGKDTELRFLMRTHTSKVDECWLIRKNFRHNFTTEKQSGYDKRRNCSSSILLHGSPPDLKLTLHLKSVGKGDEGHWTLQLRNDVGLGQLALQLVVVSGDDTAGQTSTAHDQTVTDPSTTFSAGKDDKNVAAADVTNQRVAIIVGANIAGVVIIVAAIVGVNLTRARRARGSAGQPSAYVEMVPVPAPLAAPDVQAEERSSSSSSQKSHAYEDVQDAQEQQGANLPPPPAPCGKPSPPPDDYLHPVASKDKVVTGEQSVDDECNDKSSLNAEPLYENSSDGKEEGKLKTVRVESTV